MDCLARQPEEVDSLGRALTVLRVARGMSQKELAASSGLRQSAISQVETGWSQPKPRVLDGMLKGMGCSWPALERAKSFIRSVTFEASPEEDDLEAEEYRKAALRLAQEAGKAVAHVALAFLELGAGRRT